MSRDTKINPLISFASVVAIFIAIVFFALQLLEQYAGIKISGNILSIAQKVKDLCLVIVVACCALAYGKSKKESAIKTLIYVCVIVFLVLAIVGVILI